MNDELSQAKQHPNAATRTRVMADHAVIAPDGHVAAPLPGWDHAEGVVLISPAMGAAPRNPRFVQTLIHTTAQTTARPAPPGVQRFVYVLAGRVSLNQHELSADGYAWLPPNDKRALRGVEPGLLLVIEQTYQPLGDQPAPRAVLGHIDDVTAQPFMDDPHARLAHLLPDQTDPTFDLAINRFTFDPAPGNHRDDSEEQIISGTALPFVETHYNEHGLYLQHGTGVYRLGSGPTETWTPVIAGDAIWMAAFCPQWFVATGEQPATYIYSKNINRDPLQPQPSPRVLHRGND